MIGGCILSSVYTLQADLMTKKRNIDTATGQIDYVWELWKSIDCLVSPFTSTSFKAQGAGETFGPNYEYVNYLRMKTPMNLGRNLQVTNIREKRTQKIIYVEQELKGAPPSWYNTQGSDPELDPFGRVIQYDTVLVRAEVQGNK